MSKPRQPRCPQCGEPTVLNPTNPFRPFCSERCKLLDFGAWVSGSYTIPAAEEEPDSEAPLPPPEKPRLQ